MMVMQRKVAFKFTGSDDYKPELISRDKHYPVIGYEVRRSEKQFEGEMKIQESLYYLIIDDKGKPVVVASWNGETVIDKSGEPNWTWISEKLQNLLIAFGSINEKLFKIASGSSGENGGKDGGR